MSSSAKSPFKVALLWRGDRQARLDASPAVSRLNAIFEALARRRSGAGSLFRRNGWRGSRPVAADGRRAGLG